MNPNADYLGIVTLLRGLREQGLVSGSEAKKIAARLMVQLGADIIISLYYENLSPSGRGRAARRGFPCRVGSVTFVRR